MIDVYIHAIESSLNYSDIVGNPNIDIVTEGIDNSIFKNIKTLWDKLIEAIAKIGRTIRAWFASKRKKTLVHRKGMQILKDSINSVSKKVNELEREIKDSLKGNGNLFNDSSYKAIEKSKFLDLNKLSSIDISFNPKYSDYIPLSERDKTSFDKFYDYMESVVEQLEESSDNYEDTPQISSFLLKYAMVLYDIICNLWEYFHKILWEPIDEGEVETDESVEVDFDIFEEPGRF